MCEHLQKKAEKADCNKKEKSVNSNEWEQLPEWKQLPDEWQPLPEWSKLPKWEV